MSLISLLILRSPSGGSTSGFTIFVLPGAEASVNEAAVDSRVGEVAGSELLGKEEAGSELLGRDGEEDDICC